MVFAIAQGPCWELEVFTVAKAFAMVLKLSPWSLPWPKTLTGSWRCSPWPGPSPWSSPWSLPWTQGPHWELEVFTMAKVFAKVFDKALELSPWSLPRPQGSHWELEVLTVAKAFAKVFARALELSPWSLPWPQGPCRELEVFTMAKAFA